MKAKSLKLRSNYPYQRSADVRKQKSGKTGYIGRLSADNDTDFDWFFGQPTTFFPKHSSSNFRWPIRRFSGVLPSVQRRAMVARWSSDGRPTFWRNLHHDIGRRSPDGRLMNLYQRTVGIQMPDVGRHSADYRPAMKLILCYIVNNECIYIVYELFVWCFN